MSHRGRTPLYISPKLRFVNTHDVRSCSASSLYVHTDPVQPDLWLAESLQHSALTVDLALILHDGSPECSKYLLGSGGQSLVDELSEMLGRHFSSSTSSGHNK